MLLLTLCILSLNYAKGKLDQRYVRTDDIYGNIGFELSGTRQYLDALGVSKNAKTIILSDNTPNGGLYFIIRPGWSVSDTTEGCLKNIDRYIEKGAEYIIFTDKKYIYKRFKSTHTGEENGIWIYKLR